jgi:tRNA nucleotidyltransferase (CCA-adding enzyme)
LNQSGYEAYLVGGAIRDHLLSARTVLQDHDIVTSALPDDIQNLFSHSVDVGKSFGVIKIPIAEIFIVHKNL